MANVSQRHAASRSSRVASCNVQAEPRCRPAPFPPAEQASCFSPPPFPCLAVRAERMRCGVADDSHRKEHHHEGLGVRPIGRESRARRAKKMPPPRAKSHSMRPSKAKRGVDEDNFCDFKPKSKSKSLVALGRVQVASRKHRLANDSRPGPFQAKSSSKTGK